MVVFSNNNWFEKSVTLLASEQENFVTRCIETNFFIIIEITLSPIEVTFNQKDPVKLGNWFFFASFAESLKNQKLVFKSLI